MSRAVCKRKEACQALCLPDARFCGADGEHGRGAVCARVHACALGLSGAVTRAPGLGGLGLCSISGEGICGPLQGRKWGAGFSTSGVPGPPVRPEGVKLLRSAITGHQSCDPSPPWCSQQH